MWRSEADLEGAYEGSPQGKGILARTDFAGKPLPIDPTTIVLPDRYLTILPTCFDIVRLQDITKGVDRAR